MQLVMLRGLPGCGKTTIGRALSKRLGWPLIDKDDIKDVLEQYVQGSGGYSYEVMLALARRQLLQGLNVICDSPLVNCMTYERAQAIAIETGASLMLVECLCSDQEQWRQRINARKTPQLATHRQIDWESFQIYLLHARAEAGYPISHPLLVIDTIRPLSECMTEIVEWLGYRCDAHVL